MKCMLAAQPPWPAKLSTAYKTQSIGREQTNARKPVRKNEAVIKKNSHNVTGGSGSVLVGVVLGREQ